jgi:membrane protein YqaA with SNARE-associated domain
MYGKTVNLWLLASAATMGTLAAAFLDYKFFATLLNLSYSKKYKSNSAYKKAHYWFYKAPFISLLVAGFTPIPFYIFKFMALSSRYPLRKYMLAVALGRFPRYCLLAFLGFTLQIPNWIILVAFAGMFLLVYYRKILGWIAPVFLRKPQPNRSNPEDI